MASAEPVLPRRLRNRCRAAGDVNSVTIGDKTSVQDNVLIHVAKHNAAGKVSEKHQ